MGYTNETTHYSIPLPLGSDKTTPMDYNQSAQEVDTVLFEAKTDSASALQKANQLQQDLATTNGNVTGVTGRVTTLEGTVTTQGGAILQNTQDIADVRADALDMIEAKDEGTAQVASVAVAKGEYFRYNDVLYIATQNIAVGDTIVPNTNCRATNVGTELNQLNNDLSNKVSKTHTADYTAHKDGTRTWAQLLNLILTNIDFSKVNAYSLIVSGDNYFKVSRIQSNHLVFVYVNIGSTTPQIIKYNIQENNNVAVYWDGTNLTDISSNVADEDISIFY